MGKFFVSAESVRLDLPKCGSWVEIKRELNRAEHDSVIGAGLAGVQKGKTDDGAAGEDSFKIDPSAANLAKLKTWIVDWGFTDTVQGQNDAGETIAMEKPVPVSRAAIENLRVDVAAEILEAIEGHQARMEEEKKAQATGGELKAISG